MMLALHGTGVSSGISIGKAHVLQRERPTIPEYNLTHNFIDSEVERFCAAIEATRAQMEDIRDHIPGDAPSETVNIIDTHLLILADSMVSKAPIETIRTHQCNAEWALTMHAESLTKKFESIADPYISNRKTDINQVVDRIVRNLLGLEAADHAAVESGAIVVATDLTPADTVLLKHNKIRAFVTDLGGPISHTAILARSLNIPAIVSVHNASRFIRNNEDIIIDGKRGVVIIGADSGILSEYKRQQKHITRIRKELDTLRAARAITPDGVKIRLEANIELPADVKAADKASAAGIGLYRTEFLFMNRSQPPSEEEQLRAYNKVIKAMGNKPITIRTLDLGADKQVDGGATEPGRVAINPALGLRAVRLCLNNTDLFKPQLRAILRASANGKIRMMIPMLSNLDELFRVLDLVDETKAELRREHKKFNSRMPIGGMIEVPAAAITADIFAPYLDFFSIGTNDLIQYTLAIDRVDDSVNYLYDPLHPSILRLISMVIDAGNKAGIPVSMCGEMAGEPRFTRLLLGMGLTTFSMHPATMLHVKKIVRNSNTDSLKRYARKVLRTRDARAIHGLVDEQNEKLDAGN
ncbi:MAG: phosphoenolpyruvate--protein phosphotransferase [Proteobacteria bacterium]|nr:phosphoenolpyruvate--protein phosphotransferase [Pseudomonadota bacterium]